MGRMRPLLTEDLALRTRVIGSPIGLLWHIPALDPGR
jgi:hypothetical protein